MDNEKPIITRDLNAEKIYELLLNFLTNGSNPFQGANVTFIKHEGDIDVMNIGGMPGVENYKPGCLLTRAEQQSQEMDEAGQCRPKPLLSINEMEYYFAPSEDPEELKLLLHREIDGYRRREVALRIYCFVQAGRLTRKPNYRAVLHEFGDVISKPYYNECFRGGFFEDEKVNLIERYRVKVEKK